MGKVRKGILRQQRQKVLKVDVRPQKDEEWSASQDEFYRDDVDVWNEDRECLMLNTVADIEPASFSEDEGSDREVLGLELSESEEEDEIESDGQSSETVPSDKAWGDRKKSFYDTDFNNDDVNQSSDESQREEEEREAMSLQKRLVESIGEQDFGLEILKAMETAEEGVETNKKEFRVAKELSSMSERERLTLLQEQWPEFLELYGDLKEKTTYSLTVAQPFNHKVKMYPTAFTKEGSWLLQTLMTANNLYCLNVMFYVMLRAESISAEDHPVIKRIVQLRDLLSKLRSSLGKENELKALLERLDDKVLEKAETDSKSMKVEAKPILKKRKRSHDIGQEEDPLEHYDRIKHLKQEKKKQKRVSFGELTVRALNEGKETKEGEEETVEGKRGITYQISQNKGLTPKRKKDQRNPRVKHRKKYGKAVKKYNKVVRPVEKELDRYGGERGGIKLRLSRSVKIK